jgi:hypothetical protein
MKTNHRVKLLQQVNFASTLRHMSKTLKSFSPCLRTVYDEMNEALIHL